MRSFLGLLEVSRRLVLNFTRKAVPSHKLKKKGASTKFGVNACERAVVDDSKQNLIEPPVLVLFRTDKPFSIETAACYKLVGCVILQPQNDGIDLRQLGY